MHSPRQLDTVQTQEQLLQRLVTYSCLINTVSDRPEFCFLILVIVTVLSVTL